MPNDDVPHASRAPVAPASDPYQADAYPREDTHLLDYVKVLVKRRWTVVTVFLVVVLCAVVYAFMQTPIYEARARLMIEIDEQNVVQFQQVLSEQTRDIEEHYETQYQLLRSRSLVRRTLDELALWDDPVFLGVMETGGFSPTEAFSSAVDTMRSLVAQAVQWVLPTPTPVRSRVWDQDEDTQFESEAVTVFLEGFTAAAVPNSRLVDLRYRSTHPRLATMVVNTHADAYIDQTRDFRFQTSRDATDWLSERLEEQRRVVEASEAALIRYRQGHDAISLEDRENIVVQRLTELNAALTRAKTELISKEATYRQLESFAGDPDAIDALPAVMSNGFVQEVRSEVADLRRQYAERSQDLGARHPDMIRLESATKVAESRLQVEIDQVVESVHNEFLVAQAQERSLSRELDAQKTEALAMNEMGIDYGVLVRDAASNREIFESLLQRAKETGVTAELPSSTIRVIDHAEVPRKSVSPQKGLILLIAMLGGGMGGVGLAFLIEYLDNRIKTPEELRIHLGLPSLGLIPTVPSKSLTAGESPLINNGVPANFSEAFRAVRTGVLFSTADSKRSFVITSTGINEGKSVVAANLAIGLAQAQQRVLLIDGDMRRPTLHKLLGRNQEPGLSNLLVGDATSEEVLQDSAVVPGLWLLTAGKIPPNPAELLGSERFKAFLETLLDAFDWVLIDTPPVMAVTDAAVVAHATAGVIFVIGADMTSRHAAQQALDRLEAANGRFVGAILNRVDLQRNAYYYSSHYRSEYEQYYTQDEKPAASTRARNSTLQI